MRERDECDLCEDVDVVVVETETRFTVDNWLLHGSFRRGSPQAPMEHGKGSAASAKF